MEEFDALLTDISRVNIEITRTKAMKVPKMDKKNIFFLNLDNPSLKKTEITPEYFFLILQ